MCSTAENPTSNEAQAAIDLAARLNRFRSARRRRKEALLPQINNLALEGHSCREIGARLGVSTTTVHRWLQKLRQESRSKVADSGEMIANSVARYDAIYREAMEAWRSSKADNEVRRSENTEAAEEGGLKKKKSMRTKNQRGEIAFLAAARSAVDAICKLVARGRGRIRWGQAAASEAGNLDDDELRKVEALHAQLARLKDIAESAEPGQSSDSPDEGPEASTEKTG
jgi:transposase-like protein